MKTNSILIFAGIILLVGLSQSVTASTCNNCEAPNRCVADNVCSCYGNHMKSVFGEKDDGTYFQECINLRGWDGWKGFFISGAILIVFLCIFYFGGEAVIAKSGVERPNITSYPSTEYLNAKNKNK